MIRAAAIIALTIGLVGSWTFAAQAASNVIWNSAFTDKGFAKFKDTPHNDVGAAAPVLVTSTVNAPEKAARFTVPGGGTRSEIEPKVFTFTEGSDYYFGDSFTLRPASRSPSRVGRSSPSRRTTVTVPRRWS